jgi:hypothetical protein
MGIKDTVRPKAKQKVDNLVGELYVRPEHLDAAIAEVTRMMTENVDAQAEVATVLGTRIATLDAAIEALQHEVRALRAEIEARSSS